MEARNRFLPEWFERIRTRQIALPRFQRMEAWGSSEISGMLTTVLRGLPAGATLILEVGDSIPFISRTMMDAPDTGERITELLLDGQQRLTALWRGLNDKYTDRTYLVWFEDDPHAVGQRIPTVYGQPRWGHGDRRYPLWVDDPKDVWSRGYIPLSLLRPGDIAAEIDGWVDQVADGDWNTRKSVDQTIDKLRSRVREFNLPFLSLPVRTPKDVALDVFIKMNTSSIALTTFDILVAQVEAKTEESLHDLVAKACERAPAAIDYKSVEDLILDTAALMQDRTPNQTGYAGMDLDRLVKDWNVLVGGIRWMTEFLESECILDSARLPTDAVLAVLAALHSHLPVRPDALGNAKILLRKYLWRAFFTGRYERAASTNTLQDFRGLRGVLRGEYTTDKVPVLDDKVYPLPTAEQLMQAGWPKNRITLSRGILNLTLKCGARDIADDAGVTREHLRQREYHHLFPAAILRDADVAEEDVFRAMNCALITWRTNRSIAAKEPLQYLRERAEANTLGEEDLRRKLRSHLIPFEALAVGGYESLDSAQRAVRIRTDYQRFLELRANIIERIMQQVCAGQAIELANMFEVQHD